jgi:hypothetical protein
MGHRAALSAVLLLAVLSAGNAVAQEGEAPPAAPKPKTVHLLVSGGPVAVDVDVLLNGEFVATVGSGDAPLMQAVDDLLKPGINEVRLVARKAEDGRKGEDDLRIQIAPVRERGARSRMIENPFFSAEIPADAALQAECMETGRFSAGTPPAPVAAPKGGYWMFVSGPPTNHRISVQVNDWVVGSYTSGEQIVEITPYVSKGKNTVSFDGARACFKPASGREGPLDFVLGYAEKEHEVVKMRQQMVEWQLSATDKREAVTKKANFRGW